MLEQALGGLPIEVFIRNLADTLEMIELTRQEKPWEIKYSDEEFLKSAAIIPDPKFPAYRKPERSAKTLL